MSEVQELPAGIGAVFPFAEEQAWRARMAIIARVAGIEPATQRHDDEVMRASYASARSRTILNWSSLKVLEKLHFPGAVMTVEVEDTKNAAFIAQEILADFDYVAEIIDAVDVELGIPSGFMYFVLVGSQVPLLFWPKRPDPAILAQMTPPEPWTDEL